MFRHCPKKIFFACYRAYKMVQPTIKKSNKFQKGSILSRNAFSTHTHFTSNLRARSEDNLVRDSLA